MNEDDLEAQKLKIIQKLSTLYGGRLPRSDLQRLCSRDFDNKQFNEVLDLLVKEWLVRIIPYDFKYKEDNVCELTEEAKTKYGITVRSSGGYIPQNREPTKYVNVVNSAGVIVDTREVMDKGTLRTILAGICIFTIIAIIVLIFLSQ